MTRLAAYAHAVTRAASVLWSPTLVAAALLFVVAGVLQALGRPDDSYGASMVAALLAVLGVVLAVAGRQLSAPSDPEEPS
jgi:hypothetical protein